MKALVIVISALIFVVGIVFINIPIYTIPGGIWKLPVLTAASLVAQFLLASVMIGVATGRFYAWFNSHIK